MNDIRAALIVKDLATIDHRYSMNWRDRMLRMSSNRIAKDIREFDPFGNRNAS